MIIKLKILSLFWPGFLRVIDKIYLTIPTCRLTTPKFNNFFGGRSKVEKEKLKSEYSMAGLDLYR